MLKEKQCHIASKDKQRDHLLTRTLMNKVSLNSESQSSLPDQPGRYVCLEIRRDLGVHEIMTLFFSYIKWRKRFFYAHSQLSPWNKERVIIDLDIFTLNIYRKCSSFLSWCQRKWWLIPYFISCGWMALK